MWTTLIARLWTTRPWYQLFLGVLVLALSAAIFNLPTAILSLAWPTTEGVVLTSKITLIGLGTEEGWCASVFYSYPVDGKEYRSDKVELQSVCNGSTNYFAQQVIQRYPVGTRVKIYYDPRNPAFAVLEPGIPDNDVMLTLLITASTGVGVVLFVIGLLRILRVLKHYSSERTSSYGENAR